LVFELVSNPLRESEDGKGSITVNFFYNHRPLVIRHMGSETSSLPLSELAAML
jgi:hypothetical protein